MNSHKTIFGTTERSNFILNMKPASVERLNTIGLLAAILFPLLTGGIFVFTEEHGTNFLLATGIYVTGFAAILFYLINALRGDTHPSKSPAVLFSTAILLLALVSYYVNFLNPYPGLENPATAYGTNTALFGAMGRYEGLLALIAYFGIFLLATCIKNAETFRKVIFAVAAAGAVQALFALLQHIPGLGFPNAFKDLPTYAYDNVYLASGLSDSPIFYGAFVTLVFSVCAGAAVLYKNNKDDKDAKKYAFTNKARLALLAVALLSFTTGLFTSSVTPIIGCAIAGVIIFFLALIQRRNLLMAALLLLAAAVIFLIVLGIQGIWLRDTYIARFDGFYRKHIIGSTSNDPRSVYENGRQAAIAMIKAHPLFGVGADSFAAWQNFDVMTYDKPYNEFLFIAATRGIPSAVIYTALIITAIVKLIKNIKNSPVSGILLAAVISYVVQSFFNASAVTVAPVFFIMLGLAFSPITKNSTGVNKNE